ncbi:zona pellucida-binding protein 2 isoform X9 [Rattus norvegicus]|uniref:zona pellucida-binding protein 2 isoform X9 n=1 Tax=Rattus norvegicus TaxID=10116 RepID=UPI001917949C|nr:zona pellucida-binding protein 2 isoform X4 [Rattus norvegicus]
MLAWALLSAVLWSLAGVGSARSSLFSNEGFVYGTVGHPVKIYVKLHQTSPVLVCMDIDRASKETVDPIYLWIGPNENTLTGSSQINITNIGELVLKDFMESLSGHYSCTLSYKIVKAETQEETSLKKKYDFLVFVNPFAPGWKSMCNSSMDCEDVTNHNILKWSVVLERSVPIWMSPVRPVFLPMSTEPKLAHKRQEQRRTHGCLPLKVEAKIRSHRRAS